jgi:hypothetical protein
MDWFQAATSTTVHTFLSLPPKVKGGVVKNGQNLYFWKGPILLTRSRRGTVDTIIQRGVDSWYDEVKEFKASGVDSYK